MNARQLFMALDKKRGLKRPFELAVCISAIAVIVMVSRGIWFGDPVADIDEQIYSFIGWRMQFGELPYVDWWDRKPFGLFAIFGFAHFVGGPGPLSYQVIAALAVFAGAMLVFALSRPLVDRITASIAAMLYALLLCAYACYSAQSEVFHIPLVLSMLLLVRDPAHPQALPRAMAAMAVGGVALQVKYTVLPECLFLGGWALWGIWRQGAKLPRLAAMAFGFAMLGIMPTVIVGLLYLALGHWDAFYYANFVSFFDRAPSPDGRYQSVHRMWLAPVGIMVVLGLYAARRLAPPRLPRLYALYGGFLISSLATVYVPSTVYQYYFAALIPGSVLLALPLLNRAGPLRLLPGAVLVGMAIWILQIPQRAQYSQDSRAGISVFAQIIAQHVGPNNCLFIYDGPPALYRLSGGCTPTHFAYPDHLSNELERDAIGIEQEVEVARILATEPGVIVISPRWLEGPPSQGARPPAVAQIRASLAANYQFLAENTLHGHRVGAWVRTATSP